MGSPGLEGRGEGRKRRWRWGCLGRAEGKLWPVHGVKGPVAQSGQGRLLVPITQSGCETSLSRERTEDPSCHDFPILSKLPFHLLPYPRRKAVVEELARDVRPSGSFSVAVLSYPASHFLPASTVSSWGRRNRHPHLSFGHPSSPGTSGSGGTQSSSSRAS